MVDRHRHGNMPCISKEQGDLRRRARFQRLLKAGDGKRGVDAGWLHCTDPYQLPWCGRRDAGRGNVAGVVHDRTDKGVRMSSAVVEPHHEVTRRLSRSRRRCNQPQATHLQSTDVHIGTRRRAVFVEAPPARAAADGSEGADSNNCGHRAQSCAIPVRCAHALLVRRPAGRFITRQGSPAQASADQRVAAPVASFNSSTVARRPGPGKSVPGATYGAP